MSQGMRLVRFDEVNIDDPFFDSLKNSYREFEAWFKRKSKEEAYVIEQDGTLVAFLYIKLEEGKVEDVIPPLPPLRRLKIGTFKIDAHGTRLGERFLKKAFDHAFGENASEIYVTVFPKYSSLIKLFKRYGFVHVANKHSGNGIENVLLRQLHNSTGDVIQDYPLIHVGDSRKYLLSIWPKWHTKLFPDSILHNESPDLVHDVSHTNSIHKVYICFMDVSSLERGDVLVIYRTSDKQGPARYRSVITSVCVVEELKSRDDFVDIRQFLNYCRLYSVFSELELRDWYIKKRQLFVIRFTYNAALHRRITRGMLLDKTGLSENDYWGFLPLSDAEFGHMIRMGGVYEGIIVD